MSLRMRTTAPLADPALAWCDVVHALAEEHQARRAIAAASRWPLAHDCPRHGRWSPAADAADPDPSRGRAVHRPFCCRALA